LTQRLDRGRGGDFRSGAWATSAVDLLQVVAQLVLPLELLTALAAAEVPALGVTHHVQLQLHLAPETFVAQCAAEPA
jgi:hypothetical protein